MPPAVPLGLHGAVGSPPADSPWLVSPPGPGAEAPLEGPGRGSWGPPPAIVPLCSAACLCVHVDELFNYITCIVLPLL